MKNGRISRVRVNVYIKDCCQIAKALEVLLYQFPERILSTDAVSRASYYASGEFSIVGSWLYLLLEMKQMALMGMLSSPFSLGYVVFIVLVKYILVDSFYIYICRGLQIGIYM